MKNMLFCPQFSPQNASSLYYTPPPPPTPSAPGRLPEHSKSHFKTWKY